MIRVRATSNLVRVLLLMLLVLALAGCSSSGTAGQPDTATSASRSTEPPAPAMSPSPSAAGGAAHTDPAVAMAAQFERAHCAWTWQKTRQAYLAGQQQLATAGYAQQLASASDPSTWQHEVIAQKQTVTCTVSAPVRDTDAPSTATTVYVRMHVTTQISSTLGSFVGGDQVASWRVVRTADGWRVAGSFEGG